MCKALLCNADASYPKLSLAELFRAAYPEGPLDLGKQLKCNADGHMADMKAIQMHNMKACGVQVLLKVQADRVTNACKVSLLESTITASDGALLAQLQRTHETDDQFHRRQASLRLQFGSHSRKLCIGPAEVQNARKLFVEQ